MTDRLASLPKFPAVVLRLLRAMQNEDVQLREIAALLETDPALATDVLVLANSAMFGFTYRIRSVVHAISVLGLARIKTLAFTVAARAYVRPTPPAPACWSHNLAAAVIAEELAPAYRIHRDAAYTCALMHDVGRLGMISAYPEVAREVFSGTYEAPDDIVAAEIAAFTFDHCAAGRWLARAWSLPDEFGQVSEGHHGTDALERDDLVGLSAAACLLADGLHFAAVPYRRLPDPQELAARLPVRWGAAPDVEHLLEKTALAVQALN